jgi:hypothetical protein
MSCPKTYLEKLKDPRWQKKRLEIFQRDDFTCQKCGDKQSMLHVHHWTYLPNIEPWDYPGCLLATLCNTCHGFEFNKNTGGTLVCPPEFMQEFYRYKGKREVTIVVYLLASDSFGTNNVFITRADKIIKNNRQNLHGGHFKKTYDKSSD